MISQGFSLLTLGMRSSFGQNGMISQGFSLLKLGTRSSMISIYSIILTLICRIRLILEVRMLIISWDQLLT